MLGKLNKLKGRSIAELRERVAQKVSAELEYRGVGNTIGELTDSALAALLDASVLQGSSDVTARLHASFFSRAPLSLFAGIRDGSTAAALKEQRWVVCRDVLHDGVDKVLRGEFHLLGYADLKFGNPIDWHFDPVARIKSPRLHWSRIPYLNAAAVGDHKVIWELNRHQHFLTLGRAFRMTGDVRYAERFVEHITSWMNDNPPKVGINWASSLEVSYRSISWVWALELFHDAPQLTPALFARIAKFAYVHARHLERYLSTYFSPNTHLTGEALGLMYLGSTFREFRDAATWRERGWQILVAEIDRQILPDGVYFEQTTYYHRYTLDIYLHAILLARSNGWEVPARVIERVTLLARCLANMTRADGTTPAIGDDDGGQLVLLESRRGHDTRSALAIAGVVLACPELGAIARAVPEEVLWMLGPDGVVVADANAKTPTPEQQSHLYATGGYAVMRHGYGADAMHAVIDCGPLGTMNCGHAHADALAIELSVDGAEILVDPGTYSYTTSAADRALFRHSAMHNTVTVNGQPSSVSAGPFSWLSRTDARADAWHAGIVADRFVGSHDGFMRLPERVRHQRTVLFVRGAYWVIVDTLIAEADCELASHWHFAPFDVRVSNDSQFIVRTRHRHATLDALFSAHGDVATIEMGESWVSESYGARHMAPSARMVSRALGSGARRRDLIAVVAPIRDKKIPQIVSVPATGGHALQVTIDGAQDHVLIASGDVVETEFATMRGGEMALLRHSADGKPAAVALFGADASLTSLTMKASASGAFEKVF